MQAELSDQAGHELTERLLTRPRVPAVYPGGQWSHSPAESHGRWKNDSSLTGQCSL